MLYSGLLPYPKKVAAREGTLCRAHIGQATVDSRDPAAYAYLFSLSGVRSVRGNIEKPCAVIEAGENVCLAALGGTPPQAVLPEFSSPEAYAISVAPGGMTLCARTEEGLAMAVKTAVKLLKRGEDLPCAIIQDAPDISFRALHMCIFEPGDGTEKEDISPAAIRQRLLLAALSGYNHVFLEFWGTFPFQRRPYAVWPDTPYTPDIISSLVSYCLDDLHITPCPAQNLTSHAGWSRIISRRHVVLDQRPDLADMWIPGGWCFATENPDTQAFLKDIMDEELAAFRNPPYFHIGCDKAFGFGSTEEDRTKPADMLFTHHVCFLNTYLNAHRAHTVMWADMLYTSMDSLYFKCAPGTLDRFPRNILMNLWTHNDIGTGWSDVPYFEDKGFSTVYSPFLDIKGVRSMIAQCKRSGSFGLVQTTWHRPVTCKPVFVLSGALQWHEIDYQDSDVKNLIQFGTEVERG